MVRLVLLLFILFIPSTVGAQVFDPTTYAPAIAHYLSARADWRSSQPYFQHGLVERNPRFTVSGLPYDTPVSYSKGMFIIERDSVIILGISAGHNVLSGILLSKHTKVGLIERIGFAAALSYGVSINHINQTRRNLDGIRKYRGA